MTLNSSGATPTQEPGPLSLRLVNEVAGCASQIQVGCRRSQLSVESFEVAACPELGPRFDSMSRAGRRERCSEALRGARIPYRGPSPLYQLRPICSRLLRPRLQESRHSQYRGGRCERQLALIGWSGAGPLPYRPRLIDPVSRLL